MVHNWESLQNLIKDLGWEKESGHGQVLEVKEVEQSWSVGLRDLANPGQGAIPASLGSMRQYDHHWGSLHSELVFSHDPHESKQTRVLMGEHIPPQTRTRYACHSCIYFASEAIPISRSPSFHSGVAMLSLVQSLKESLSLAYYPVNREILRHLPGLCPTCDLPCSFSSHRRRLLAISSPVSCQMRCVSISFYVGRGGDHEVLGSAGSSSSELSSCSKPGQCSLP